jgi:hypothetical protein
MTNKNPKYRLLNAPKVTSEQRTYIILGLGRSGTSFISSVLGYFGIFSGDRVTKGNLEDMRLTVQIEAEDYTAAKTVIEDYNARFDVWAYKRPSMLLRAAATESLFRNPHYIFTHRDFFALALRNEMDISRDIAESMRKSVAASKQAFLFLYGNLVLPLSAPEFRADGCRAGASCSDRPRLCVSRAKWCAHRRGSV